MKLRSSEALCASIVLSMIMVCPVGGMAQTATPDTNSPEITITSPSDGEVMTDTAPLFRGYAEPGAWVWILRSGKAPKRLSSGEDGHWAWSPDVPLEAGKHAFDIWAEDRAGNITREHLAIVVDLEPPTFSLLAPRDGAQLAKHPERVVFELTETSSWSAWLDGALLDEGVGSAGEVEVPLPDHIEQGSHHVLVHASDAAGNTSRQLSHFIYDATPPSIALLAPLPRTVSEHVITTIEASVDGDDEVVVSLLVDGVPRELLNAAGGREQTTRGEVRARLELAQHLGEGEHELTLTARDRAGNEQQTSWVIAVELPTTSQARIDYPESGALLDALPVFAGMGEPGESLEVFVSGSIVATTVVTETGHWQAESVRELPLGAHEAWARIPGEPLSESVRFHVRRPPAAMMPTEALHTSRGTIEEAAEDMSGARAGATDHRSSSAPVEHFEEGAACALVSRERRGDAGPLHMLVWLVGLLALHLPRRKRRSRSARGGQ